MESDVNEHQNRATPNQTSCFVLLVAFVAVLVGGRGGFAQDVDPVAAPADPLQPSEQASTRPSPAEEVAGAIPVEPLRLLVGEVLARNPELASLAAQASAAEQVAPQVRALPDPMAALTAYLLTPETRVGPQRVMASLSQRFPWFGKLALREQAALYGTAAARARLEARRLELVTETRRLAWEIAFLDAWAAITRQDRETLAHYEELARARYASGVGLEQAVVKIQAEITKDDNRLLEITRRRVTLVASMNALRDLPQDTPLPPLALPASVEVRLDVARLRDEALARRPELVVAQAEIDRAATMIELAHKDYYPDVTAGLTYALVTGRDDAAGRQMPPPDNSQDVLGLSGAVNLPIWKEKLAAGVEEAVARRLAAEEAKRSVVTRIDGALGDLAQRLPLIWRQVRLFNDVLLIQAEQSLRSAEAGYAAGTLGALDLLDAERVLLEVRIAAARADADHAVAQVALEGAVATPLTATAKTTGDESDD